MIQICSLQKDTISTFIIKDRQKREALMWPDELQSFRIALKNLQESVESRFGQSQRSSGGDKEKHKNVGSSSTHEQKISQSQFLKNSRVTAH